jgi:hypothetical protein
MRRALALGVAVATIFAVGVSAALAAGALPKLATGWFPRYTVRPHTIYYTGDSTGTIGRLPRGSHAVGKRPGFLHWKTWNGTRAFGVGTVWIKSCLPDCAGSPFSRYAATVTATKPVNGRFSTMTLRYRYHGHNVVDTRCDSGHGYYVLPPHWPKSENCLAQG